MRILSGLGTPAPRYESGAEKGESLGKSQQIADLFNNRPPKEGKEAHAKLRLSHSSRLLTQQLQSDVQKFLGKNKDVARLMDEIDLSEEGSQRANQQSRKLVAYLRWLQLSGESIEAEPSESEKPYLAIKELNKDDEMRAIYEDYTRRHQEMRQQRQRSAPNYYYLAYPETYSFN